MCQKSLYTPTGVHTTCTHPVMPLAKRTTSDKTLKDKFYEFAINTKYDGYQRRVASMVYKFFEKKTGSGASVIEELAQELHKQVIKLQMKKSPCEI